MCADPYAQVNGAYVGHDEPSLEFKSQVPGSGNDMTYNTNSITLGGGESIDVILDASDTSKYSPGAIYYLYTPNLDHLSNDAENFGGLMTEVHICRSVDPTTKSCT